MELIKTAYRPCLALFLLVSCIEPYDPPVDDRDVNVLVVDAFLDASAGVATVNLTRSLPVESEEEVPAETGAHVLLEDDKGNVHTLTEEADGVYTAPVGPVSTEGKYRLLVTTTNEKEYASALVPVTQAPAIDSISYGVLADGVQFYVTTHDPHNTARYYRWTYEETYEYNSQFNSVFMFEGDDIIYRPPALARHKCWKSNVSTDIFVGTSEHLKDAIINRFPLSFVPRGSIKLTLEYSLLVRQQVITREAYEYWSRLQKTTEQVGGLFDPLPSEVRGNIQCLSDPSEHVLGFFSAGTVREMRRFVRRAELPEEAIRYYLNYDPSCVLDTVSLEALRNLPRSTYLVDAIYAMGIGIVGYTTSAGRCVDCTLRGGTTTKPDFWR